MFTLLVQEEKGVGDQRMEEVWMVLQEDVGIVVVSLTVLVVMMSPFSGLQAAVFL